MRESGGVSYTVREPARMAAAAVEMRLATSPEGHMSAPGGVLEWITRAGAGDEILVQQVDEPAVWANQDNPRVAALVAAALRGADVIVMLEDAAASNQSTVAALQELGIASVRAGLGNPTGLGIHNNMHLMRVGGGACGALRFLGR